MKIIQIAVSSGGENWNDTVYGLSDKGDLYYHDKGKWNNKMKSFDKQNFDKEVAYEVELEVKENLKQKEIMIQKEKEKNPLNRFMNRKV